MVGKYCGSDLPEPVVPNSNVVLIRFEADTSLEAGGFIIKYDVVCGGVFTDPSGILVSPYYPKNYPASKDCVYLISQPLGTAIIVTMQFMDIEEPIQFENETEECYFDRLEIRDGDTENSTLLASLCGSENLMPKEPFYSTYNYMYLEFFTDKSVHNLGFKANYTTVDRGEPEEIL